MNLAYGGFFVVKMKIKKYFILSIFVPVIVSVVIPTQVLAAEKTESNLCAGKESCVAKIERVIDGDTIKLDTGEKVRYIGIDAPEMSPVECFGKEAFARNKELLEGKEIKLEKDVSDTDKYGRLLRYVYVTKNDTEIFVNDYLVRNGFANYSGYPPDIKHQKEFQEAEKEAKENKRGIWADGICDNLTAEKNNNQEIVSENEKLKQEVEKLRENCSREETKSGEWFAGFIWGILLTALGIWGYGRLFKR